MNVIPGISGNQNYQALNSNGATSGFKLQYQDQIANADQVHHFAAFFQLGFTYGSGVGMKAATWWERLEGTAGNTGDINLGRIAATIGANVRAGVLPVKSTRSGSAREPLQMTATCSRIILGSVVSSLLLCLSACGVWESKAKFAGFKDKHVLELRQPFPANISGLQVVLRSGNAVTTIYEVRGDTFVNFADAQWNLNDSAVGLLTCGTPSLHFAYSRIDARPIPFSNMEHLLGAHIQDQYHLDKKMSEKSIFDWACSSDGERAFRKLHPEALAR